MSRPRDRRSLERYGAIGLLETPCIEIDFRDEVRRLTVAEYEAAQQRGPNQPLWGRRVPPVEKLADEPSDPWNIRIIDAAAYRVQLRRLIGID